MADVSWSQRIGATPGRLAVIAVLAAVLISLLLLPSSETAPDSTGARRDPPPRRVPRPAATVSGTALDTAERSTVAPRAPSPSITRPLPTMRLDEAVTFDPFALGTPLAQVLRTVDASTDPSSSTSGESDTSERDRVEQTVAALRQQGVEMVVLVDGERTAVVGDRVVRVGDLLDGLRVTSITTNGIVLSDESRLNE